MSKQVLAQIQQQILKPQTIVFASIRQKLQKEDPKSQLAKVVDIFLTETYDTLKPNKKEVPQRFMKKLRLLSILSYFFQLTSYNLLNLSKQLELTKDECVQLLIEANIYKLVSVNIDEERNLIAIRNSKIRQRQISQKSAALSREKINFIKEKNAKVLFNIQKLKSINEKQQKISQLDYKSYLSSFRS